MRKIFKNCFKFLKKNKIAITLFVIVLFGAFLRFWGLPARYGFDIDATRDAILTQYAAAHFMWPLIGAISALGSFNFGPWYYYQLILFQHFVPLAYAPWIYVSLTSIAVIVIMFGIGSELFSKEFGLVLALLTAFSPGQIGAGTGLSNPDLISLFAAFSIWLFVRLLKAKGSSLTALLLGLAIGIGINCHYQMIYFVFLPFMLFIFVKKGKLKLLLFSLFGIFLSFLPLIFFNLTHHFQTLSGLIDYYILGKNKVYVPNRWLLYLFSFWPNFWGYVFGFPSLVGLLLTGGSILTSLILVVKRKVSLAFSIVFLFFIMCFIFLRFFSGERANYYLLFLHPFLILYTGVLLWQAVRLRFGKIMLCVLLLIIVAAGFQADLVHTRPIDSHVQFVSQESFLEKLYPNKKFAIFACDGQYKNQIQGMVFLMSNKNLLGNDVKIGFKDSHCKYPERALSIAGIIDNQELDTVGAVDITHYSTGYLKSYGWTLISPAYLYTSLLGY
jgi:4-amino-4-deoxy-L-arabinose transferase-like glycosyltransferase